MRTGDLTALAVREFASRPRRRLPTDCGVLAACDANAFKGFQLLYSSVVLSHRVGFLLADIGMTDAQVSWAVRQPGLLYTRVPAQDLPVGRSVGMWQTWNKPFYVALSPFRRTLWLDCDMVVLPKLGLAPLFEHCRRQPYLQASEDHCPNAASLYDAVTVEGRDPSLRLAGGVFCLDAERDAAFLAEWMALTRLVFDHPGSLYHHVALWDQGVMRLAVERLNLYRFVWPDLHWNKLVHGHNRCPTLEENLTDLSARWPEEYVLHFYGGPKTWEGTPGEVLDIEPNAVEAWE